MIRAPRHLHTFREDAGATGGPSTLMATPEARARVPDGNAEKDERRDIEPSL